MFEQLKSFFVNREKMRLKYKVAMMQTILCTIYRLVSRDFYRDDLIINETFYHWWFVEFEVMSCNLLLFIL